MSAAALDTHQLFKNFLAAGFNEQEAEAQVEAAKLVFTTTVKQVYAEIKPRELATSADLQQTETRLELKIEKTRNSILLWTFTWTFSMFCAQTGLIFGILG
jgi:hypothetical protein